MNPMRGPLAVMAGAALTMITACTTSGLSMRQTSSRAHSSAATSTTSGLSTRQTSSPTQSSAATSTARRVTSTLFEVAFSIPASWRVTPHEGPERVDYDGPDGWLDLVATSTNAPATGMRGRCLRIATSNVLNPYGTKPTIQLRTIDGRAGCIIHPSADALRMQRSAHGPSFTSAAAIVCYHTPITFPSTPGDRWGCLLIVADPAHITAIADSVLMLQ